MSGVLVRPEGVVSFSAADRNTFNGNAGAVACGVDKYYLLRCVYAVAGITGLMILEGGVTVFTACLFVQFVGGVVWLLANWPRRVGYNRWGSILARWFSHTIYTPVPVADSSRWKADLVIIHPREIGVSYRQVIDTINDSGDGLYAWERFAYYHTQAVEVRERKESVMWGERWHLEQQEEWYAQKRDYYRLLLRFPNQSNL